MKKGEKQSPEMKAKVLKGMMKKIALQHCTHNMELVPRMGCAGYLFRCPTCRKLLVDR